MTLPSEGRKLEENEISSIENAVKEAGIQQIHPDKMEAFAEELVSRLKGSGKHWRKGGPLED
jgi:hypothetical protein